MEGFSVLIKTLMDLDVDSSSLRQRILVFDLLKSGVDKVGLEEPVVSIPCCHAIGIIIPSIDDPSHDGSSSIGVAPEGGAFR